MRILKFLSGGTPTLKPITDPFKAQAASNASASAAASKKSGSGLISDDLMKRLYDNGIPSDVDDFLLKVGDLEYDQSLGLPVSAGAVRKLEALGNRVIQQAKYLKNAEEAAYKNDALGEIAVGSRGLLFVADKQKGVKEVSLGEFNPEKMAALTVGEIIEARKFSPSQAWNLTIIPAVGRNLGMSKITDYIQNIIKTVGSTSNTQEAYTDLAGYIGREAAKKPSELLLEQLQGLTQLMEKVGADAIFKNKQVMESKNMEEALTYIESVLPQEMKRQLISRHVAQGYSYESSPKHIRSLIAQALMSGNEVKVQNSLDFDAGINKAGGTTAAKNSELKRNLGVLELLVQGTLGKRDFNLTSSKDPNLSMTLKGTGIGALSDFDNNIIPKSPLSIVLQKALGPLVDLNHISIGNQKLNPSAFDSILYNGQDVINIWAPTNQNGDVDLDRLAQFNALLNYLKSQPELTDLDKLHYLLQYGFAGRFDQNGNFVGDGSNMGQFLVFTGLTSDEIVDGQLNLFADKLSGPDKDFEMNLIDRIYGAVNKGIKNKDQLMKFEKGWFDWTTDLYYAPIFMKLNPTAQIDVGTFSGKGPLVSTQSYDRLALYDLARYNNEHQQIQKPSTALMFE